MDQTDEIFKIMAKVGEGRETVIACLYTGTNPPVSATAMPRVPHPPIGAVLDQEFGAHVEASLAANEALHDGAIMLGRAQPLMPYLVTGWSYRLFPPPTCIDAGVNRGSAFHSCLAMSAEGDVDATYLVSHGRAYRFSGGVLTEL